MKKVSPLNPLQKLLLDALVFCFTSMHRFSSCSLMRVSCITSNDKRGFFPVNLDLTNVDFWIITLR